MKLASPYGDASFLITGSEFKGLGPRALRYDPTSRVQGYKNSSPEYVEGGICYLNPDIILCYLTSEPLNVEPLNPLNGAIP